MTPSTGGITRRLIDVNPAGRLDEKRSSDHAVVDELRERGEVRAKQESFLRGAPIFVSLTGVEFSR